MPKHYVVIMENGGYKNMKPIDGGMFFSNYSMMAEQFKSRCLSQLVTYFKGYPNSVLDI